jgi:ATP-dependent exoDNAse (exonuclease V) beta subunit
MATLIPALGACVSRMTSGEKRLAERLEQNLDNDLLCDDVAISCGRNSEAPLIINFPTLRTEATKLADQLEVRAKTGSFHPHEDTIKVMTMHASKGLEFPVVALMGVGQMPAEGEDERDEARLFYVGATRATQMLVVTVSGDASFATRLANAHSQRSRYAS